MSGFSRTNKAGPTAIQVEGRRIAAPFFFGDYNFHVLVGRRFVVNGRVQRVGFRLFVEDAAHRENISGYVRNRHDGSVEVVAEGDAEAMQRFELAVRRGPAGARVDEVDTAEVAPTSRFSGFRVTG